MPAAGCEVPVPDQESPHPGLPPGVAGTAADLAAAAGALLAGSLNLERTLERLLGLLVPAHATMAQVTLTGTLGRQEVVCRSVDGEVEHVHEPAPDGAEHGSVAGVVLTGRRARLPKLADADLPGLVPVDRIDGLRGVLGRPAVVLPLEGRGAVFGTLTLLGADAAEDDATLRELEAAVRHAGLFVDAARLYAERTRVAGVLQRGLRPPLLPDLDGVRIAGFYRPADDTAGVGGDFYDLHGQDGDWTVVLGDVAGKGVEAAVQTGAVRQAIRTAALIDRSPARIVDLVNRVLLSDGTERFVTLLCGRLRRGDTGTWCLDLAVAGHPPPFVLRRDGEVASVGARGTVVGAVLDAAYEEVTVTLDPGDACLLFTDGVTESRAADGELFGRERIAALLPPMAGSEPEALVEHVARASIDFGKRGRDDIAMLAVRVDP
jgi:phosphoserine phosphatase RsbU/P